MISLPNSMLTAKLQKLLKDLERKPKNVRFSLLLDNVSDKVLMKPKRIRRK